MRPVAQITDRERSQATIITSHYRPIGPACIKAAMLCSAKKTKGGQQHDVKKRA